MIEHYSVRRRSKLNTENHLPAPVLRGHIPNRLRKSPAVARGIFGLPLTEWICFGFTNNRRAVSPGEFAVLIDILNSHHHRMTPLRLVQGGTAANGNQRCITKYKLATMVSDAQALLESKRAA